MAEGGAERELRTEQAILSRYQDLRNELATLSGRANELAAESQEHDLVLKALEPLDGGRRCYRVVRPPSPRAGCHHACTQCEGHEHSSWHRWAMCLWKGQ